MTGRGLEAFQKILRKISNPTCPGDKNSNPIKILKNNFRPQHIITERKHSHSSFKCLSFYLPLSDRPVSVHYLWLIQVPKTVKRTRCQVKITDSCIPPDQSNLGVAWHRCYLRRFVFTFVTALALN